MLKNSLDSCRPSILIYRELTIIRTGGVQGALPREYFLEVVHFRALLEKTTHNNDISSKFRDMLCKKKT